MASARRPKRRAARKPSRRVSTPSQSSSSPSKSSATKKPTHAPAEPFAQTTIQRLRKLQQITALLNSSLKPDVIRMRRSRPRPS